MLGTGNGASQICFEGIPQHDIPFSIHKIVSLSDPNQIHPSCLPLQLFVVSQRPKPPPHLDTFGGPRLVESDDVAEILSRLAAISSREKALELLGREN